MTTDKPRITASLRAARAAFKAHAECRAYRKHYGADAFTEWLRAHACAIVSDAVDALDAEDKPRLFTLHEINGLVRLDGLAYIRFLRNIGAPDPETGDMACRAARLVRSLNGTGPDSVLRLERAFRQRTPSVAGLDTYAYWLVKMHRAATLPDLRA